MATYDEKQIRALIERAAELQAQENASDGPGLSLAELEEVARASGIDPKYIRAAAAERQRVGTVRTAKPSATHIYAERVVDGDLDEDAWEDLVLELRHRYDSSLGMSMGMPGYGQSTVEHLGRTHEWKHTSMSGIETRVSVRHRDGQQHVRLSQRVGLMSTPAESVMYAAVAAFGLGFPGSLMAGIDYLVPFVMLAVFLVALPLIYMLDTKWRAKKQRELNALADTVSDVLAAPAARRDAERLSATHLASVHDADERIALPDDDDHEPVSATRGERTRN